MVTMLEQRLLRQRMVSERLKPTLVFAWKSGFGRTGPRGVHGLCGRYAAAAWLRGLTWNRTGPALVVVTRAGILAFGNETLSQCPLSLRSLL